LFVVTLAITFFTRNNYRGIDEINPAVLKWPLQTELTDPSAQEPFTFTKDAYNYEVIPLYNYEVSGMIVNKFDYTRFSIYERNAVFPMDLCIIWGSNVGDRVFQAKSLTFSQDARFCRFMWSGDVKFNRQEVSNNHLVVADDHLERIINSLNVGDQIRIKGKLVNVKATRVDEAGKYDPEYFDWRTSTNRSDTGAGACETIYVEDIEILQKSNTLSYYAFKVSLAGLGLLALLNVIAFFAVP